MTPKRVRKMEDRIEAGRALRERVPREVHAEWTEPVNRPDPVATLVAQNADRLAELVPIRFGRMLADPFAFLRGSAAVMAHDIATTPLTGISVQLCGDCHLMNFGLFATPERNVVFGLNDFDETIQGTFEYDLKRLAASFAVAALDAGMSPKQARKSAEAVVASYRTHLWRHVTQSPLEIWYEKIEAREEIAQAPDSAARKNREQLLQRAQTRVGDALANKMIDRKVEPPRIVDQPPLLFHPQDMDILSIGQNFLELYRLSLPEDRRMLFDKYQLRDAANKVVGVGSVGTRCFVALLTSSSGDPLLLQIKEAAPSVLEPLTEHAPVGHNGERVVIGQRLMQAASDIFLGWASGPEGRHFYVRQLRDMKLSVTIERDPVGMARYAEYCGRALARAHANSGDGPMIAGYLGNGRHVDKAIGEFAMRYAVQTVADHAALSLAQREGRIEATFETL